MSATVNIATGTLVRKRRDGQADRAGLGAQGTWASTGGGGFGEAWNYNPTGAWDFTQAPTVGGVAVSLTGHIHDDRYFTETETTSAISTAIANLVASSPATLDTLNELATALGDDPNFATTVSTAIGLKAPIANPTFTGTVSIPNLLRLGDGTSNFNTYIYGVTGVSYSWNIDNLSTGLRILSSKGGASVFNIDFDGNVGIGNPAPTVLLTVGKNGLNGNILSTAADGGSNIGSSLTFNMTVAGGYANSTLARIQTDIYNPSRSYNNALDFFVGGWNNNADAGTAKMSILSNGNVGIGTTTPLTKLEIQGALSSPTPQDMVMLSRPFWSGNYYISAASLSLSGGIISGLGSRLDIKLLNGSYAVDTLPDVTVMSLLSNGNVLIGQTSGSEKFCVTGNQVITSGYLNTEELRGNTTFVAGFYGAGYKMVKSGSDYNLECDNIVVRKGLRAFTYEVDKIDIIGGRLVISTASGTVYSVSGTTLYFDTSNNTNPIQFKTGDYIAAQQWAGNAGGSDTKDIIKSYRARVTGVVQGDGTLGNSYITTTYISGTAYPGMRLAQMGNDTYSTRQNLLYMSASDTNNPFIEGHSGVTDGTFSDTTRKFRLGKLDGITDPTMGALTGHGLYSQNAYLTGRVVLPNAGMTNEGSSASSIRIYAGSTYANRGTSGCPFFVTQDGSMTARGIVELGTAAVSDGTYYQNIAMVGNEIRENSRADDWGALAINLTGYLGTTSNYRMTTIGNGKGAAIATFRNGLIDLNEPVIIENNLDVYGAVDLTVSSSVNLGGCHNIAVGSTDITCSASEVDMTGMTLNVVPKGNKLFIMFSAPFYITAANQTLNLYINVAGSDHRHTTTYIASGFQSVSFSDIISVTPNTSYTVKIKWLGSTSIQQRGSTDAERVLTVIDLM